MATTISEPRPSVPPDLGVFCVPQAWKVVLAQAETATTMRGLAQQQSLPQLLEHFISLKLLAPLEAGGLVIAAYEGVGDILARMETRLVEDFKRQMREER